MRRLIPAIAAALLLAACSSSTTPGGSSSPGSGGTATSRTGTRTAAAARSAARRASKPFRCPTGPAVQAAAGVPFTARSSNNPEGCAFDHLVNGEPTYGIAVLHPPLSTDENHPESLAQFRSDTVPGATKTDAPELGAGAFVQDGGEYCSAWMTASDGQVLDVQLNNFGHQPGLDNCTAVTAVAHLFL